MELRRSLTGSRRANEYELDAVRSRTGSPCCNGLLPYGIIDNYRLNFVTKHAKLVKG